MYDHPLATLCFQKTRIPKHRLLSPQPYPRQSTWRRRKSWVKLCLNGACLLVMALLLVCMATESFAEASKPLSETTEPEATGMGELRLTDSTGKPQPALRLNSEAHLTINGMVVHTRFQQSFKNTHSSDWMEGTYVFPLPDTAAISRLQMRIGERVIEGKIREKQTARQQYTQAKASGKTVALVEQQRPNLFTQKVANIGPNETVTVMLEYTDTVHYDQGLFSTRLPTTITPRFIPQQHFYAKLLSETERKIKQDTKQENADDMRSPQEIVQRSPAKLLVLNNWGTGWGYDTDQVPDASEITPAQTLLQTNSHHIHIDIHLNGGLPMQSITSPYHDIVVEKHQQQHVIRTRSDSVPMDRDFVLQWRPVSGRQPQAASFVERRKDADYALIMLLPPELKQQTRLRRDIMLVIDTSGSMGGTSIEQAKQSVLLALSRLDAQDQFNIIEFNSTYRSLFENSQTVNAQNLMQARGFVSSLSAGGGTEMASALAAALQPSSHSTLDASDKAKEQAREHDSVRQVVFITDGSVGNESQLFNIIHKKLGRSRLFTVGIGSAPNSHFMRKAAQFGRGTFTHIGSIADVQTHMTQLFEKLQSPVLQNLQVQWPNGTQADVLPARLPDLYQGEPLLMKVRLPQERASPADSVPLTISGNLSNQAWRQPLELRLDATTQSDHQTKDNLSDSSDSSEKGIAKLWARQRISDLLDNKVRASTTQQEITQQEALKQQVLHLALSHQLLSPYTSFIAIEEQVRKPQDAPTRSKNIGNLIPQGQQPLALPKGSTPATLNAAIGLGALLMLLGMLWQGCRETIDAH